VFGATGYTEIPQLLAPKLEFLPVPKLELGNRQADINGKSTVASFLRTAVALVVRCRTTSDKR